MTEEWLEHLERTVHEASETVESLRRENEGLEERLRELEGELEKARAGAKGGSKKGSRKAKAGEGWREERDEIRRRVESLTDKLEGLLDESA